MDAVEFFKEKKRMCSALGVTCEDCLIREKANELSELCSSYVYKYPDEAVAIVEQWAKEHPKKTRQSELLKMFPRVSMTADGIIAFCPDSMDSTFVCPIKERDRCDPECGECRKKYWLEEVKEDDKSND